MLLANFNLANTCVAHVYAHDMRVGAHVFGGINFGYLVKNSPIRQIKSPQKFPAIRYLDVKPCSYKFNITMFKLIFWVPILLSSCIFAHTLFIQSPRSASTFHCHCVLMICMAACVSVYCCVVMMLSLKCSLLPGWYYSIKHFLSGGTYSSGGTTDCSQGRCQPSG